METQGQKIVELLEAILATLQQMEKKIDWIAGSEERAAQRALEQVQTLERMRQNLNEMSRSPR